MNLQIKNIVIYANSSSEIGAGHVMRQLALAQQARLKNMRVHFIFQYISSDIQHRLETEGFKYTQFENKIFHSLILKLNADALVIDDYDIDGFQKAVLEDLSIPIIYFDDHFNQKKITADIIVNSADNVTYSDYPLLSSNTKLCLGHEYRLIRQEFLSTNTVEHTSEKNRLLITIGASDVKQLTVTLVEMILEFSPKHFIDVVISQATNQQETALRKISSSFENVSIHKSISNMGELMLNAKLAITAAGGTLYELAAMGIPTVAIGVANNQKSALHSKAINKGFYYFDLCSYTTQNNLVSMLQPIVEQSLELWQQPKKLNEMEKTMRQYIDGLGSERVLDALREQF